MFIEGTGCCAVKEIEELSSHVNAEEAMMSFCKEELGGYHLKLSGHYIFTGVVRHKYQKPLAHHKYGPAFKAYILKHKLGSVSESRAAANHRNHPNHIIKVWVWQPNLAAVKKWWAKHNPVNDENQEGL